MWAKLGNSEGVVMGYRLDSSAVARRRVAAPSVSAAWVLVLGLTACVSPKATALPQKEKDFARTFSESASDFASTGHNPYFILEPGYVLVLEGTDGGRRARLTISVLDETITIDGVETRVVEERELVDGKLVEVSRNYFAISKRTGNVYYFGEATEIYRNGKVAGREDSWKAGVGGATYGLLIAASPKVGDRYYQEVAPKVAMDRAEVVSTTETVKVPAGEFTNCVKTEETNPLEPGEREYKWYAPGVGLLIDGGLKLVRYGRDPAVSRTGTAPASGRGSGTSRTRARRR
jgi:hypothetical protein